MNTSSKFAVLDYELERLGGKMRAASTAEEHAEACRALRAVCLQRMVVQMEIKTFTLDEAEEILRDEGVPLDADFHVVVDTLQHAMTEHLRKCSSYDARCAHEAAARLADRILGGA